MLKFLVIAVLLVAAVTTARKHPELAHGWTGGCTVVQVSSAGDAEWRQCHAGRLAGKPNLSRDGCTAAALGGPSDLWRCPASVSAEYKLGS